MTPVTNAPSIAYSLVTFLTIQQLPPMLFPAGFGQDPRPVRHRRLMPDVLSVAACQISNPIPILILVISNNWLVHQS